ncbi:MAG: hydroxyectoine utilization dehydratase EutB [Marinomonas colpomeniae]
MTIDLPISLNDISCARDRIRNAIRTTPTVASPSLSELMGVPVYLKLEHQQLTGSFKLRGATHAISQLNASQRRHGVVAASTGNHGRGLAYAARAAGVPCIICMSKLVPQNKLDGIKAQGAEIRIVGNSQDDAEVEAKRLVAEENMTMLPPFDHPDIISGQGTLGLELLEQLPELDTVLIQLSGGGLISGVAAAIKAKHPNIKVIGVSMKLGAAMHQSISAGKPVLIEELPTLADSLGGGIGFDNRYTFSMVQALVDDIILLSEKEIAAGIHHAYWQERQIVEGAGAVGIAALLSGKVKPTGTTAIILSGENIDLHLHHRIISGENVDASQES